MLYRLVLYKYRFNSSYRKVFNWSQTLIYLAKRISEIVWQNSPMLKYYLTFNFI